MNKSALKRLDIISNINLCILFLSIIFIVLKAYFLQQTDNYYYSFDYYFKEVFICQYLGLIPIASFLFGGWLGFIYYINTIS